MTTVTDFLSYSYSEEQEFVSNKVNVSFHLFFNEIQQMFCCFCSRIEPVPSFILLRKKCKTFYNRNQGFANLTGIENFQSGSFRFLDRKKSEIEKEGK